MFDFSLSFDGDMSKSVKEPPTAEQVNNIGEIIKKVLENEGFKGNMYLTFVTSDSKTIKI